MERTSKSDFQRTGAFSTTGREDRLLGDTHIYPEYSVSTMQKVNPNLSFLDSDSGTFHVCQGQVRGRLEVPCGDVQALGVCQCHSRAGAPLICKAGCAGMRGPRLIDNRERLCGVGISLQANLLRWAACQNSNSVDDSTELRLSRRAKATKQAAIKALCLRLFAVVLILLFILFSSESNSN